jgi:ribosome-dependent ATPase
MHSSLGAYTKGLGFDMMMRDIIYMLICIPILLLISVIGLRKQEK